MILECLDPSEIFLRADWTLHDRVGGVGEPVHPEELLAGGGVLAVFLLTTETTTGQLSQQISQTSHTSGHLPCRHCVCFSREGRAPPRIRTSCHK